MANPSIVTRDAIRPLTARESAAFLGCCPATVRREAQRKRLRGQKVGAHWRFAPEDLAAYLSRVDSTADYTELHEEAAKAAPRLTPAQLARLSALFNSPTDPPARD